MHVKLYLLSLPELSNLNIPCSYFPYIFNNTEAYLKKKKNAK